MSTKETGKGENREETGGQRWDMMEGAKDDGQRVKPQKWY